MPRNLLTTFTDICNNVVSGIIHSTSNLLFMLHELNNIDISFNNFDSYCLYVFVFWRLLEKSGVLVIVKSLEECKLKRDMFRINEDTHHALDTQIYYFRTISRDTN